MQDMVKELSVLISAFVQLLKLISIIMTLPISTSSNERFFSTLKRVKTYVRSLTSDARLSDLMLISTEKNFIRSVDKNKLVDKFGVFKERKFPVMHKHNDK